MGDIAVHIVMTTCPDQDSARRIAGALVAERLAACVNILPGVESVFEWKGEVQNDPEVLLLIKSPVDRFAAIQARFDELHPYELPELVAVPISTALPAFADWIVESCRASRNE